MSKKFKLWNDPYDRGFNLYKKRTVEINPGVTVLVGCNGIGKSTLLHNIEAILKKENIPVMHFNNLCDGGSNARSEKAFLNDFSSLSKRMTSSEGENIVLNLYDIAQKIDLFLNTGNFKKYYNPFEEIFKKETENISEANMSNERWILFDAVDSGLSVDNIIDLKEGLFKPIIESDKSNEIFIVISANEYEMANGEQCFDVYNGKYITFKNYEDYRSMIIQSRKWKENRTKIEN